MRLLNSEAVEIFCIFLENCVKDSEFDFWKTVLVDLYV